MAFISVKIINAMRSNNFPTQIVIIMINMIKNHIKTNFSRLFQNLRDCIAFHYRIF